MSNPLYIKDCFDAHYQNHQSTVIGVVMFLGGIACATDSRPNGLLIVSEDNGPEIGSYGDLYAQTPNLDVLATAGVRFANAYVPQAGCSPSRAAFLTGLYPYQNG